ncbi:hypothetical protein CY34DRAFT_18712 [Suillus luteus UH-Slu-Lm8-n1]|uniref:Uncharacterized protein n=1 Tax=Suillus luteus UH-Slu-Lm8-n1 TaxID=930992 RepID=A0A0D0AFE4_9AGAM|nr:hypothetical protein CY34DRAFT_18712 [Suillus luteus UH-Slu-Lm8-n1]
MTTPPPLDPPCVELRAARINGVPPSLTDLTIAEPPIVPSPPPMPELPASLVVDPDAIVPDTDVSNHVTPTPDPVRLNPSITGQHLPHILTREIVTLEDVENLFKL